MVGAGREAKRRRKTLGNYIPSLVSPKLYSCRYDCIDAYLMISPAPETETGEKAAKEEAVVENTTPDYAAGLVSTQVPMVASLKHSSSSSFDNEIVADK